MSDVEYYDLLKKLKDTDTLIKALQPRLQFNWEEKPLMPIEVVKLCNMIGNLVLEIGQKALENVDAAACRNHLTQVAALGNPRPYSDGQQTDTNPVSSSVGQQGTGNQQRLDDLPSGNRTVG